MHRFRAVVIGSCAALTCTYGCAGTHTTGGAGPAVETSAASTERAGPTGESPAIEPETRRLEAEPISASQDTEQLIAFVNEAAAEIHARGRDAFSEFAREGSRWNHDDVYLFAFDANAQKIAFHGADPAKVGIGLKDLKGAEGRAIGQYGMEVTTGRVDHMWLFYKWLRPQAGTPAWKASYLVRVKDPSGAPYVVGSGVYDLAIDRRLVTELVNMAADWIGREGQHAIDLARDKRGPFVYKDMAVFVIDTKGEVLADPLYPDLQDKNQIELKDEAGRPIQRDLIKLIEERGSGWANGYEWARPGGGPAGQKDIFMRRVQLGARTLGVGSGLYVD